MTAAAPAGLAPALAALLGVQVMVSGAGLAGPVLAPLAAPELGFAPHLVGMFVGATWATAAIAGALSGGFIRRFGALRVSQIALGFAAAACLIAAAGGRAALIPAALLFGLAYGPATPASSHLLARLAPPARRNLIFSVKQSGVPLGNMLAGAALPSLALAAGWRWALVATAVACAALALAIEPWRARLDVDRVEGRIPLRPAAIAAPLARITSDARLRRLCLASATYAGMQGTLGSFLVVFLTGEIGMPLVTAGLVLSTAQAAGAVGRPFWGVVADRVGRPAAVLAGLGLAMAMAAVIATAIAPDWPLAATLGVALLFGGTAVAWNGVFLAEIARAAPPGEAGALTGASALFTFGGNTVLPAAVTVLVGAGGSYAVGFWAVAAACAAIALRLALARA